MASHAVMRYALRSLLRQPLFTVAATVALGAGIGANSTVFTLANAMLFRPMPGIAQPESLVWILSTGVTAGRQGLSYPEFLDYRQAARGVFEDVFAFQPSALSLAAAEPQRLRGHLVSGRYFAALGVQARVGRLIGEADDRSGAPPVAVISHRLWRDRFAEAADVLSQTVTINGRRFAIAGVADDRFVGPVLGEAADVWVPLAHLSLLRADAPGTLTSRDTPFLTVMARLRPDSTRDDAQAAVGAISRQLELMHPEAARDRRMVVSSATSSLPSGVRDEVIPIGALLLVVSGVVLMVACANVANLLLARGVARLPEMRIRAAIGATRLRLLGHLLAESAVLGAAGVAAGLLISFWTTDLILLKLPEQEFRGLTANPDARVVVFTSLAGLASVCMAGILPALSVTRGATMPGLRASVAAANRTKLQGLFVVAQLALSLVLLLAGGLSLRALHKAATIDPGFTPDGVLLASYDLELQNYPAGRRAAFRRELRERVQRVPGVASVSIANMAPLSGTMVRTAIETSAADGRREERSFVNGITPGFLDTLSIPLLRGRDFSDRDGRGAAGVAIVNETLARRLWADQDPIGRSIVLDRAALEVIGLARDAKYDTSTERAQPFLYTSLDQHPQLPRETLVVKVTTSPAAAAAAVREVIRQLDPALPVFDQRSMVEALATRADRERGISVMLGAFGAIALLLASLGLYSVMSFAVTCRTREIGIRMALGAAPGQLVSLVARDTLRLAFRGVVIGALLSLPLAFALGAVLFGVTIADVATFAAICLALVLVALAAAAAPMRRASRLDPITALRTE